MSATRRLFLLPHEQRLIDRSLAERAYVKLRHEIITLARAPGEPLREDELMADLGLGRTPIREAVKRLAHERLIVVNPRSGTHVSHVDTTEALQIAEVRIELERFAAELAAQRATPAERRELERLRAAIETTGDADELMRLDYRVHHAIYRASRNAYLQETADLYLHLALRVWFVVLERAPELLADVTGEHGALIAAIVSGDHATAGELARSHVSRIRQAIATALPSDRPNFRRD